MSGKERPSIEQRVAAYRDYLNQMLQPSSISVNNEQIILEFKNITAKRAGEVRSLVRRANNEADGPFVLLRDELDAGGLTVVVSLVPAE